MTLPIIPLHEETAPRWLQDSPAVRAVPTLDDLRAARDEQYEAFQLYWTERNEGKDFTESRLVYFAAMERFADLSTQRFMARMKGVE